MEMTQQTQEMIAYFKNLTAADLPTRNQDFFDELTEKRKEKEAEKRQAKIDSELTKLKSQQRYKNADDDEKTRLEEELKEQCKAPRLNKEEIVNILKYQSNLFHCINLRDTATDKQKELYIFDWDKGIYTADATFFYEVIAHLHPSTTEKMDKEIYYDLTKYAAMKHTRPANRSGRYIAFKNGIFDGKENTFSEEFNPDIVLLSAIPFEYNSNATEPIRNGSSNTGEPIEWHGRDAIEVFKNGDEKREQLFYEVCRAIMGAKRNVFLFAWNEGGNGGKSTIGRLFAALAGEYHTKRLNIDGLGGRFALSNIERFKLILGDDMAVGGKMSPHATAVLKTLVTGTEIATESKGQDVKNSFFNGVIYQCSNALFTTDDTTGGIVRRCIFLPFAPIPQSETCKAVNDWIIEPEFVEWIIKETLTHCPNAPESYTEPTNNEQYKQDFKENNDPFIALVDEYIKPIADKCERIPLKYIYNHPFNQFIQDYPTLERTTIQQLNSAIKDKMSALGYELKKQARINKEHFPITYKDANGSERTRYDNLIKENNQKTNFSNVYVRG